MTHDGDENSDRLGLLLALQSLLSFTKVNANGITTEALADAIDATATDPQEPAE